MKHSVVFPADFITMAADEVNKMMFVKSSTSNKSKNGEEGNDVCVLRTRSYFGFSVGNGEEVPNLDV
jgi:hypothetical protein